MYFFFNDTATPEIYTYCHTLSLHDALPISIRLRGLLMSGRPCSLRTLLTAFRRMRFAAASPWRKMVSPRAAAACRSGRVSRASRPPTFFSPARSEEHTSELQSLMRISYAVFCLKKNSKQHHG